MPDKNKDQNSDFDINLDDDIDFKDIDLDQAIDTDNLEDISMSDDDNISTDIDMSEDINLDLDSFDGDNLKSKEISDLDLGLDDGDEIDFDTENKLDQKVSNPENTEDKVDDFSIDADLDLDNDLDLDADLDLVTNESDKAQMTQISDDQSEADFDLKSDLGLEDELVLSNEDKNDADFHLDLVDDQGNPLENYEEEYGVALKSEPETIEMSNDSDDNNAFEIMNSKEYSEKMKEDVEVENIQMTEKKEIVLDEDQSEFLSKDIDDLDLDSELNNLRSDENIDLTGQAADLDLNDYSEKKDDFNNISSDESGVNEAISPEKEKTLNDLDEDLDDDVLADKSLEQIDFDIDDMDINDELTEEKPDDDNLENISDSELDLDVSAFDENKEEEEEDDADPADSLTKDDLSLIEPDGTQDEASHNEIDFSDIQDEEFSLDLNDEDIKDIDETDISISSGDEDYMNIGDESLEPGSKEKYDAINLDEAVEINENIDENEIKNSKTELDSEISENNEEGFEDAMKIDNDELNIEEDLSEIENTILPDDDDLPEIDDDISSIELTGSDEELTNSISPLSDADAVFSGDIGSEIEDDQTIELDNLDDLDLDNVPEPKSSKIEDEDDTISLSDTELDEIITTSDLSETENADDTISLDEADELLDDLDAGEESETIDLNDFDADFNLDSETETDELLLGGEETEENDFNKLKDEMKIKSAEKDKSSGDIGDLKTNVKEVLSYLDQLLDALPESKIKEFAESKEFDKYKKLFEELKIK